MLSADPARLCVPKRFAWVYHASLLDGFGGQLHEGMAGFMEVSEDITRQKRKEKEQETQLRELRVLAETSMNREERILELKKRVKELEKILGEKTL